MKVKFKIAFLLFGVMCGQLLNAQFNTLKRSKVEKESITTINSKNQNQKSEPREKKSRGIKIFSSPSKAELKREIDSLKSTFMKNKIK